MCVSLPVPKSPEDVVKKSPSLPWCDVSPSLPHTYQLHQTKMAEKRLVGRFAS